MEKKCLLILGAGQHGQVVKETAEAMGYFEKIKFLDDHAENAVGKLCDYERFIGEYCFAIPAFGNPDMRLEWMQKLKEAGYVLPVIVHPTAVLSPSAQLKEAVVAGAMAVVNTHSVVSPGCIISAGAVIDHDCLIGDCCHIDAGAVVKCNSVVPAGTKVEAGMTYINRT